MEKNDISFPARIDKRGNIYVPVNVRELLKQRGDIGKMFQVTIEKRE